MRLIFVIVQNRIRRPPGALNSKKVCPARHTSRMYIQQFLAVGQNVRRNFDWTEIEMCVYAICVVRNQQKMIIIFHLVQFQGEQERKQKYWDNIFKSFEMW